jgi:hypothetical protein
MKKNVATQSASGSIDARIEELGGWRGKVLAKVRALVHAADPEIVEEWKWATPVWSHGGIVCTGEAYKSVVKMTFARGASLKDPSRLFNSSLDGKVRRAIDLQEGERIDEAALKALIRAAVALNLQGKDSRPTAGRAKKKAGVKARPASGEAEPPRLLSGGNPQVAKADGDAPVRAYIAAMPGWKRDVGRRLDALVVRSVPGVRKAVKWNSPFYGIEGRGWFLAIHTFARYVKLTFFRGASLRPVPPGVSRTEHARHLDIREGDAIDEKQLAKWVRQAAALPGWKP